MASAKWALAKAPASREACEIGAKLSHNLGLLYLSRNQSKDAILYLSRAILDASRLEGVLSLRVGSSYFQLGQTFAASGQNTAASSAFRQVLHVWGNHFTQRLKLESTVGRFDLGLGNFSIFN